MYVHKCRETQIRRVYTHVYKHVRLYIHVLVHVLLLHSNVYARVDKHALCRVCTCADVLLNVLDLS